MRNTALLLATALAWAGVTPVLAASGLARLGDVRAGPHHIVLYNDSPALITGRNALTLELPSDVNQGGVRFALLGTAGEVLPVLMRPVVVVGGAADAHQAEAAGGHNTVVGGAADAHQAEAAGGHGTGVTELHGASDAHVPAGTTTATTMLRGTADLPTPGRWRARVSVADHSGAVYTAETTLDAVEGGPNRLYLLGTVSIIAAALLVGVAARHPATRKSITSER